jgi:hypothetical protein
MTDPTRTTVQIDVPTVSNVISPVELLTALRDYAAERAAQTAARADDAGDMGRVQELAAQLAELLSQLPDFTPPASPDAT